MRSNREKALAAIGRALGTLIKVEKQIRELEDGRKRELLKKTSKFDDEIMELDRQFHEATDYKEFRKIREEVEAIEKKILDLI